MGRTIFGRVGAAIGAILAAATGSSHNTLQRATTAPRSSDTPDVVKGTFFRPPVKDNARAFKQDLAFRRTWDAQVHRTPGGLAHRRWRKARSAGRA